MLTVIIEYDGMVVYLKPFDNNEEAIDHFADLYGNLYNDARLIITNKAEVYLGEPKKSSYIS
jgi:hypothetical protein